MFVVPDTRPDLHRVNGEPVGQSVLPEPALFANGGFFDPEQISNLSVIHQGAWSRRTRYGHFATFVGNATCRHGDASRSPWASVRQCPVAGVRPPSIISFRRE